MKLRTELCDRLGIDRPIGGPAESADPSAVPSDGGLDMVTMTHDRSASARPMARWGRVGLMAMLASAIGCGLLTPAPVAAIAEGSHELHFEVSMQPTGTFDVCVGDRRTFTLVSEPWTFDHGGTGQPPSVQRAPGPALLTLTVDGSTAAEGEALELTHTAVFDHVGTVTLEAAAAPPTAQGGEDLFGGITRPTATVNVHDCTWRVSTSSTVQIADRGFRPLATFSIAPVSLQPVGDGTFAADATVTGMALAEPRGRCRATFTVDPVKAHIRGRPSRDGTMMTIEIGYDRGRSRMESTGVRCLGGGGGRKDTYSLGPDRIDIASPPVGTAAQRATSQPLSTGGRQYTGWTRIVLERILQ
jgi:hypothetical protein